MLGVWAPQSHTAHCGVSSGSDTPRVPDTNTGSATHSEQTNNTATHRAAESSTCKQSQQLTLVDQSETRQVTSASLSSSWPVGLVEAENNTCTVTFNSDSEAREEVVVVTGDTCSSEDDYAFIQWCRRYNHTDSDWDTWGRCGLILWQVWRPTRQTEVDWHWQVWRPTRQRQKWTDTVASVENNATETEVDWHWQVWRPTRQRQKWTDTVASVETNATEAEGETETRPSSSFQEAGPEVSTPPTPICLSSMLEKQNKQKKDPKCTAPHLSVFQCEHCTWHQTKKRTVSETRQCSVTKPYFYSARELWLNRVHGVGSQLTDTKLLNGRDCQA